MHAQPLPNPTQPYWALLGRTRPLPVQSDTAGLSASVFLSVLGSAALAAAIKYLYIYIYIYIYI